MVLKIAFAILCFIMPLFAADEAKRDAKIEEFVTHFGNRNAAAALEAAENLSDEFPDDGYYDFLVARAAAQILENKTRGKDGEINQQKVKNHPEFVDKFNFRIESGLRKLADDKSVKAEYLKGVMMAAKGAFIKLFFAGVRISSPGDTIRTYQEADRYGAGGLNLVIKALERDPDLCPAKFMLAKAKYELWKLGFFKRTLLSASDSLTFNVLGKDFEIGQAWGWIYDTLWCTSTYYYQKDANWDKMFVYKEMLFDVHLAGNLDEGGHARLLEVLGKLCRRFPKNQRLRTELRLTEIFYKKNFAQNNSAAN